MREIRSYGSVGVSAGNRRHYPAKTEQKNVVKRHFWSRNGLAEWCILFKLSPGRDAFEKSLLTLRPPVHVCVDPDESGVPQAAPTSIPPTSFTSLHR